MRIVGGTLRGHPLVTYKGDAIRPTSDRVREAIFNILAHNANLPTIEGAKVLDVFAGSGALGLESLSRGAAYCIFIDQAAEARGVIRRNIEAFNLQGITKVFRRDATNLGSAGGNSGFNFAFLDPPYGKGLGERALASLVGNNWLAPNATVIIEEQETTPFVLPDTFECQDRKTYGDTQVIIATHT